MQIPLWLSFPPFAIETIPHSFIANGQALMATEADEDDAVGSRAVATGKGKGKEIAEVSTSGAATAGRGASTTMDTNIEVVCKNGRWVKLKGSIEYVWSHGEKYRVNGFSCYYCTTKILGGGATRFRQHLGGISRSVVPCNNVPRNVKALMIDEVAKRRIRSKKNKGIQHFVQREIMAGNRGYGTYGCSTRIPLDEEAQIQMVMRESLREHASEHGNPPSFGKTNGSGAASCSANDACCDGDKCQFK